MRDYPKTGTVVNGVLKNCTTGEIVEILIRKVDESDCDWRIYETSGEYESEVGYNWDVIDWTD